MRQQGWFGVAGLSLGLLLAPELGSFDISMPTISMPTLSAPAPAKTTVVVPKTTGPSKAELDRKSRYQAKRAAIEAKLAAEQAAATAKAAKLKEAKAAKAAVIKAEPDTYEGLFTKMSKPAAPPAPAATAAAPES